MNYQPYYLVIEIPYIFYKRCSNPETTLFFPQTHPPHSHRRDTLPYCPKKGTLAASKRGIYHYIRVLAVERRTQRHDHISNGTLLILTRGPVCEEFVVAS